MARAPASGALLLDAGHDISVEAEAGREGEPALVGASEADHPLRAGPQQLEQEAGRLDLVVRHADRPGEHVGAATRDDCERAATVGGSVGEQTIDDLVDSAVAAKHQDDVVACLCGVERKLGSMAPRLGLGKLQVDLRCKGLGQHVARTWAGGRRLGVHDEAGPLHERHPTPDRYAPARGDLTERDDGRGPLDIQIRALSVLVLFEAMAMVLFVVLDVVSALRAVDAEWGAVWFVLVVMGLWAAGLVFVSRGIITGRRWAFTPILFTQLLFGAAAMSFFGAADTAGAGRVGTRDRHT